MLAIKIDKRLCTGIFILGILGYFDKDEIAKDSSLQYIASQLRKKHFPLKNGNPKDRLFKNIGYAKKYCAKAKSINKALSTVNEAIERCNKASIYWAIHSEVGDNAWKKATVKFPSGNEISTTDLILALLRKNPDAQKFYGFTDKKMKEYDAGRDEKRIFASSRVATVLLKELDSETAYYYNNAEEYLKKIGVEDEKSK